MSRVQRYIILGSSLFLICYILSACTNVARSVSPQHVSSVRGQFEAIEKRIRKNPESIALRIEAVSLLEERRKAVANDWLPRAIVHANTAVVLEPNNTDALWRLASLLEYGSLYHQAAEHYQRIVESAEVDSARKSEARAHLIVCQFMKSLSAEEEISIQRMAELPVSNAEFNDEAITKRSGWSDLTNLVASIAIVGGMTGMDGDARHIQVGLGYLRDWNRAPSAMKAEARNDMLAGLLSTIMTIVLEKELGVKLGAPYKSFADGDISGLPQTGIGADLEAKFRAEMPQEGREFDISDDLTIVERWDVPNISGQYNIDCSRSSQSSQGYEIPCYKWGARDPIGFTASLLQVTQDGPGVTMRISWRHSDPRSGNSTLTISGSLVGNQAEIAVSGEGSGQGFSHQISGAGILTVKGTGEMLLSFDCRSRMNHSMGTSSSTSILSWYVYRVGTSGH